MSQQILFCCQAVGLVLMTVNFWSSFGMVGSKLNIAAEFEHIAQAG